MHIYLLSLTTLSNGIYPSRVLAYIVDETDFRKKSWINPQLGFPYTVPLASNILEFERVQKRALRILFPALSSRDAIVAANSTRLNVRRDELCNKVWDGICVPGSRLHHLIPPKRADCHAYELGKKIMYHSLNARMKDLKNLFFQQWRLTPSPCNQANLSVLFHWYIYILNLAIPSPFRILILRSNVRFLYFF